MRLFFTRLDEKHNFLESFEKILENSHKKIPKNALLVHIFQKNLTNNSLLFCAFGRKTQILGKFWENFENFWWKFYWKIDFYFIFRKFVTKNSLRKCHQFSTTIFSVWAEFPPFPPWLRPWHVWGSDFRM